MLGISKFMGEEASETLFGTSIRRIDPSTAVSATDALTEGYDHAARKPRL
jgi:hypothetical protein